MSRTQLAIIVGAIILAALVVVVTLVAIDANGRHAECVEKYGIRAPLYCD